MKLLLITALAMGLGVHVDAQIAERRLPPGETSKNVFGASLGYYVIPAKNSTYLFDFFYAYNLRIKDSKWTLGMEARGALYDGNDSLLYIYNLIQPGHISLTPSLAYLSEKGFFIQLGGTLKYTTKIDESYKWIDQGILFVGAGYLFNDYFSIYASYNFIFNNMSTRTEGYLRTNNLITEAKSKFINVRATLYFPKTIIPETKIGAFLDWRGYQDSLDFDGIYFYRIGLLITGHIGN